MSASATSLNLCTYSVPKGSYTLYLHEIESGRMPNPPAPAIAQRYWQLPSDAMLADVVRAVRADESLHRDVNHGLASALKRASPA